MRKTLELYKEVSPCQDIRLKERFNRTVQERSLFYTLLKTNATMRSKIREFFCEKDTKE